MCVGQRLAGVREGKIAVRGLCLTKCDRCFVVLKAVKQQYASKEWRLNCRGTRVWELDRAELLGVGRSRDRGTEAEEDGNAAEEHAPTCAQTRSIAMLSQPHGE